MENIYPILFRPILKERIWGGDKLASVLGKDSHDGIGESWELSGVLGDVSIAANGPLAGTPLDQILKMAPEAWLGKSVYERFGTEFPLLFKFIDARDDLSIQVHPGDELAKKRHNSFGKTEMWYIMDADPGARIIAGFRRDSSAGEYRKHLDDKTLLSLLDQHEAKAGDVYFLETGTVHAIGAGILLAEIQQTSDITYRVFDWDRVDADGKSRELHVAQAIDAINYKQTQIKITNEIGKNRPEVLVSCPYFRTSAIELSGEALLEKDGGSFSVLMCVEGKCSVRTSHGNIDLKKGMTALIPAAAPQIRFEGEAKLLEICVG